jgi:hypothetical protein
MMTQPKATVRSGRRAKGCPGSKVRAIGDDFTEDPGTAGRTFQQWAEDFIHVGYRMARVFDVCRWRIKRTSTSTWATG